MSNKHKRFYLVETPTGTDYRKLESEWSFSINEGIEILNKSVPNAIKIKHLNNKMISFLELK